MDNLTLTIRGQGGGMPNYRRPIRGPGPVFFSVCLTERGSWSLLDHLDILRNAVRVTHRDRPFEILAWVVLPDHMHAIWRLPRDDPNYFQRWGRIKARFTRDARRAGLELPEPKLQAGGGTSPALRGKGESGLWQKRFWEHHIRDQSDLDLHLRYCWLDPVRHGLARKPADWLPSSIHREIRLGRVSADWSGICHDGDFGEAA